MGTKPRIVVAATAMLLTAMTSSAMATTTTARPLVGGADADIELNLESGAVVTPDGTWYVHGGPLQFTINVTNSGSSEEDGVEAAIRVPDTVDLRVDADGWNCVDMDGGVSCRSEVSAVAGEQWPKLHAAISYSTYTQDSIFVGARPGLNGVPEPGENQLAQPILLDTST
jgi:hypothetical protein